MHAFIEMYAYRSICMHIHKYACISVTCMHIHGYAYISIDMHAYAYLCICMHIYGYACISIDMHAYPLICMHFHQKHIHRYACISMDICMHMHGYASIFKICMHIYRYACLSIDMHAYPSICMHCLINDFVPETLLSQPGQFLCVSGAP